MGEDLIKIAVAAETREPSAAGHQARVAELSSLIGIELGLDDDVVDGIRIAGQLHDIGKVGLPSKILTGGYRLDFAEWELLKTHCQLGYEIVGGMSFAWPVADIILQHHERLDGSGYPAGLRGKEIIFGARIIAVADTVEDVIARSSGDLTQRLDAALDTITKGRGNLFDLHVVDACRHVLRDNPDLFGPFHQDSAA